MVVLNSVYAKGKTKVKEVNSKKPQTEEDKKNLEGYFRKIFDYGKSEYEKGFRSIHGNHINKLDRITTQSLLKLC